MKIKIFLVIIVIAVLTLSSCNMDMFNQVEQNSEPEVDYGKLASDYVDTLNAVFEITNPVQLSDNGYVNVSRALSPEVENLKDTYVHLYNGVTGEDQTMGYFLFYLFSISVTHSQAILLSYSLFDFQTPAANSSREVELYYPKPDYVQKGMMINMLWRKEVDGQTVDEIVSWPTILLNNKIYMVSIFGKEVGSDIPPIYPALLEIENYLN